MLETSSYIRVLCMFVSLHLKQKSCEGSLQRLQSEPPGDVSSHQSHQQWLTLTPGFTISINSPFSANTQLTASVFAALYSELSIDLSRSHWWETFNFLMEEAAEQGACQSDGADWPATRACAWCWASLFQIGTRLTHCYVSFLLEGGELLAVGKKKPPALLRC